MTLTAGKEWSEICKLLHEDIPFLHSQLLPAAAVPGAAGSAGAAASMSTRHLHQLVLEGLANRSVLTGQGMLDLVGCTFAAQQRGMEVCVEGLKAAVEELMNEKELLGYKQVRGRVAGSDSEGLWDCMELSMLACCVHAAPAPCSNRASHTASTLVPPVCSGSGQVLRRQSCGSLCSPPRAWPCSTLRCRSTWP